MSKHSKVELRSIAAAPPIDAEGMLLELGAGERGFGGTAVGTGEQTLNEFVQERRASARGEDIAPGWVAQTTYWILADGICAGLLRLRHCLNDALRHKGGHIGYYVRPAMRRLGIANQALQLALPLAAALGETSVMLTTSPDNAASIAVIEANGGVLKGQVPDAETGGTVLQYCIKPDG